MTSAAPDLTETLTPDTSRVGRLAKLPSGKVTKWVIVGLWVLVAGLAMGPSTSLTGAQKNDSSSWLPANAESTKVIQATSAFQSENEAPAVIVYERPSGVTPADLAAVTGQLQRYAQIPEVKGTPVGPIPSQDGKAIQVIVTIDGGSGGWQTLGTIVDKVKDVAKSGPAGLTSHVTGPAGYAADSSAAFSGIDGKLLYSAMAVVIVILLLTYRSPLLWLVPVISAFVALTVAQAVIYLLATHSGLVVNAQSAGILTVLVFGASTDYALLLVARYREELRRHEDRHEAMAYALHRAGPAIFASGATVIAGMLCLLAGSLNSTKGLGPVAAIGIGVGLLVMLTLLPALLVVLGRWVFWPIRPTFGSADHTETSVWARIGRRIARAPRRTWVVTCAVLGIAAIGMLQLNATGLSNADTFFGKPDSVVGEQVVASHFPGGAGSPVVITSRPAQAGAVRQAVQGVSGIAAVGQPTTQGGTAFIQATLKDPADSDAAAATVQRVRTAVHAVPGAAALAGGNTAVRSDTLAASDHENRTIIPLILAVVFAILALLLRAIVAPVMLIATVVLSFSTAVGLSALLFRHVLGFAGADPSLPLFVFVFLVALGIDYNIFLMTRVREEARQHGTHRGALIGLGATGGVITSAGLVLAGTFAVLGTLPVVSFAEIGIAVALGVLLDTLVVRSVLVTALTLDIGRRVWWPGRLWRDDRDAQVPPSETGAKEPALV